MVLEDWVWTLLTECFTHVSLTLKSVLSATWIILICDDHHNTSVTRKGILIYSAMFAQAESRPTLSDCSSLGGKMRFQHPVRSVIYTAPHISTHFPQSVSTFNDWCTTFTGRVLLYFKQAVLAQIQVIWPSVQWRWGPAEELPCSGHHQLLWQWVGQWRRRELHLDGVMGNLATCCDTSGKTKVCRIECPYCRNIDSLFINTLYLYL